MGTNYYMCPPNGNFPDGCEGHIEIVGNGYAGIHIAKISYGWVPLFQRYEFINSVKELERAIESTNSKILNECGEVVPVDKFINKVRNWAKNSNIEVKSHFELHGCFKDDEGYEFLNVDFL